jgi:hypothetical protein
MASKFVKVSVPLDAKEYARLREATQRNGANHAGFIRAALREKIDRDWREKPPKIEK